MATANPKEVRESAKNTLEYMYRGEGHEHSVQPGDVVHIGGNLFSPNPISPTGDVDLKQMTAEFNRQAALHTGKGSKLFKHYVISLAPGETLEPHQWLEFATAYMQKLGYDNSTKWVAAAHNDTTRDYADLDLDNLHYDEATGKTFAHDKHGNHVELTGCQHIHIMSCLVKNEPGSSLVSTSNDYQRGWSVCRHFEDKFGLRQLESPDENFGYNYSKGQIKKYGNRNEAAKHDEAAIIRARFKNLYETEGKPKTIGQLVMELARREVFVAVRTDKTGNICGISYKLGKDGTLISGSKVKSTRFTWHKLLNHERIDYQPERDNRFLGLDNSAYQFSIALRISQQQLRRIKKLSARYRVYQRFNQPWVELSFIRDKKTRDIVLFIVAIMNALRELFQLQKDEIELLELFEEKTQLYKSIRELKSVYQPDQQITYSVNEIPEMYFEVEAQTNSWRTDVTLVHDELDNTPSF